MEPGAARQWHAAARLADYQTGLYYLKVHNVADYRRDWGNDAGAWFATTAQYNRLDRAVNPDGSVSGGRRCCRTRSTGC